MTCGACWIGGRKSTFSWKYALKRHYHEHHPDQALPAAYVVSEEEAMERWLARLHSVDSPPMRPARPSASQPWPYATNLMHPRQHVEALRQEALPVAEASASQPKAGDQDEPVAPAPAPVPTAAALQQGPGTSKESDALEAATTGDERESLDAAATPSEEGESSLEDDALQEQATGDDAGEPLAERVSA